MKILTISPQPFLQPRGTPISVYQRAQALSSLGHTTDLLTYHVGQNVNIPGVKIHRIPNVPFIKDVKIGPSLAKLFLDILIFWKALTMLARSRYDLIHSHEEAGFFCIILAAMFRTRHLYDMHSSLPGQLENFNFGNHWPIVKLFKLLERWLITTCDGVITIGADLEAYVIDMNPSVKEVKIENLPINSDGPPVDEEAVEKLRAKLDLNGRLPIVYTGTFEPYQGLDLLIECAKIVKEHNPEVSFVLVGGKPEQVTYWQNEVRESSLEDCIIFAGTVPLEEAETYLQLAEILISPRTGGLSVPLKIYSYLYAGKPIVATNLYSHTQILTDETAVLVKPEKEALAQGILRLIRSPQLRRKMGLRALELAKEKYSTANYLKKLDQICKTLQPAGQVAEK